MPATRRGKKGKRKRASNAIATAASTLSSKKPKEVIDVTDPTLGVSSTTANLQPLLLLSQLSNPQPLAEKETTQVNELAVQHIAKESKSESASQPISDATTERAIDTRVSSSFSFPFPPTLSTSLRSHQKPLVLTSFVTCSPVVQQSSTTPTQKNSDSSAP